LARKVFFSFHYDRDVHRVMQVRNSWVVRRNGEATPFYDKAEFEEVKRRAGGIEKWIEQQLVGTSVTVVLYGAETYHRPWVQHEIKRSLNWARGFWRSTSTTSSTRRAAPTSRVRTRCHTIRSASAR